MNILIAPFINAIFGLYYVLGNLGWAVVVVTVIIRLVLLPILIPSLKSAKKMRELQPKLKKLQEKYGSDKKGLATAQMDLYKNEGINPLSGCLPQLLQIGVLIFFFSAFNMVAKFSENGGGREALNANLIEVFKVDENFKFGVDFLGSNLTKTPAGVFKDGMGVGLVLPLVLLLGSGALQYLSAKLMMPSSAPSGLRKDNGPGKKVDQSAYVKATPEKSDDMMEAMRTQSLYMMPAMTIFIGWNFSLGILLYWFTNSAVMLVQQMVVERMGKVS